MATSRLLALGAGVLVDTLLVGAMIFAPFWEGPAAGSPYAGLPDVRGPYLLNNSSSGLGMAFPRFAMVSVLWGPWCRVRTRTSASGRFP